MNHSEDGNHTDNHTGLPPPPPRGNDTDANRTNGTAPPPPPKNGTAKPPKPPKKNKTTKAGNSTTGKRLLETLARAGGKQDGGKDGGPKGPKGPRNDSEDNSTDPTNHTEDGSKPPKDGSKPPKDGGKDGKNGGKDGKIPNVTFSLADATNIIKTTTTPLLTAALLPNETKRYVIGYGHVGKEVKANLTINQTQAETFLTGDLYQAADCVNKELLKKSKATFTAAQTTAIVSFTQSIPCDVLGKYFKANKLAATATASDIQTFFYGLITSADSARPASSELTARRDAEKAYFNA
jgi:GH24 family phage-related lysozyme (muramidase)